jgi:DNA primase
VHFLASFIPEDKIKQIKNASDIVQIISERVILKKSGKNFLGLCPFHTEKTPSFSVSPDKQIFYCFGCGIGGNVYRFLMKLDGLSFPEVVRSLGQRCGIEIPSKDLTAAQKKRISERQKLQTINKLALDHFRSLLTRNKSGQKAMAYLIQRGMTKAILDDFKIGYASSGWNRLLNNLMAKGIEPLLIEKAGLIIRRKDKSGYYDRFRERIIFPIFDINSRIIGFGGRVMDESLPKYLNSPETPLYHKSRSLYGLDRAKDSCRNKKVVYLVEGYFDLITMHLFGITNAVATLGTSLTKEHVQILKGFMGEKGRVILVYDSDDAGIRAAHRSIPIFRAGFLKARILILPKGYDPDSYLMEKGPEPFHGMAVKALGIIPFLLESAVQKHGLSIDGKLRIISDMLPPLASIEDRIARRLHIQQLAERIGIEEAAVLDAMRKVNPRQSRAGRRSRQGEFKGTTVGDSGIRTLGNLQGHTAIVRGERLERKIIAMMIQYPDIIGEIRNKRVIEKFENATLKLFGRHILEKATPPFDSDLDLMTELMMVCESKEHRNLLASLVISDEKWDQKGCRRLIAQYMTANTKSKSDLIQRIKAAEANNDLSLLQDLLKEKQFQAQSEIKNLDSAGG